MVTKLLYDYFGGHTKMRAHTKQMASAFPYTRVLQFIEQANMSIWLAFLDLMLYFCHVLMLYFCRVLSPAEM